MVSFAASMRLRYASSTQQVLSPVKQAGKAIGHFFYGTDIRTKRTITFSYLCISLYLLAAINAEYIGSCAR